MKKNKMKYRYWHLITKSFDKRFPEGEVLGEKHKITYPSYEIFNMETGESKVVCELKYLCRTEETLSNAKKMELIKQSLRTT